MNDSRFVRCTGIWVGGVAAALTGCAVCALTIFSRVVPGEVVGDLRATDGISVAMADSDASERAPGADAPAKGTPVKSRPRAAARAKAEQEEFCDPLDLAHWFTTEMARLVKRDKLVTPTELFRQAKRAKRCTVTPLPEPSEKLSPEALYARAKPGVVVVGAIVQPRGHKHFHAALASGFVIRPNGVIATNYHVLDAFQHAKAVGVMTEDQRIFPVKSVLAADEHNDLAVIQVEAENLTALPLAASVSVGTPVYCLSHPALDTEDLETAFYAFTQGVVCGKYHLRLNGPEPLDVLTITAEYAKGSSGGPILNERGAVVGIICQTRTLFHSEDENEPQLTWKFSRPASSLLPLLKGPAKAE